MKQPWEWDEADLLALIRDQAQESLTLDYKAGAALQKTEPKKDEVSKDASAFANSAGGSIVYGMAEANQLPNHLDGIDPQAVTREWVEQVINSRIQPRIDGVRINPVDLATQAPGKVAYVVSIPQSPRAPHQAADKKYYKRFNFQSVAMEDYEVRDVARRISKPTLELVAHDTQYALTDSGQLAEARIQFEARNPSAVTATFAAVTVGLWGHNSATFPTTNEWAWIALSDRDWKIARLVIASGSHRSWSPITPGFNLVFPYLTLRIPRREQDFLSRRIVGLARLDHDGGAAVYRIEYWGEAYAGQRFRLLEGLDDPKSYLRSDLELPFALRPPSAGES